jgi:hypothetical protein
MNDAEVGVMFREHASRGVTAMRVFAHYDFDPSGFQPQLGVYNEKAFRRCVCIHACISAIVCLVACEECEGRRGGAEEP